MTSGTNLYAEMLQQFLQVLRRPARHFPMNIQQAALGTPGCEKAPLHSDAVTVAFVLERAISEVLEGDLDGARRVAGLDEIHVFLSTPSLPRSHTEARKQSNQDGTFAACRATFSTFALQIESR
jgi:hypothetical protein